MYVVEVDNTSPILAMTGMTLYQKLAGDKPDVGNLRVCGCVAFAHVPKEKRSTKLSQKAIPTLFLGYAQSSLGYRLLDLHTCVLIERLGVSFRKDITADSSHVHNLLARRYTGSQVDLPGKVPFVRLPVDGVLDSVHLPDRMSDIDNQSEVELETVPNDWGCRCQEEMTSRLQ
ncbi:hypothetical protein PC129_g21067 [Phytophthora cactorum]|nr:hypothetical protein Pcac1_g23700 [Phytophthora cactorum]KAG2877063.1 hypothetical protein PC114_g23853 [Phytophthora cactorum]KAG2893806.1 hypothetical protein PC117_g23672 [Phytophthora cactorum]KAG2971692.1 hypothetical protein PC119_g23309 [Phytophthora cactorum]KAG3186701.1 hypothetical protein C6341_g3727 [Phytophthora cactorum]